MLERLVPHAEPGVIARLRRERRWRKLANYLWVEFWLARGSARLWGGKPYWLTIDPTNFCQLQCPFCPTGANRGVRDKAAMSLEHFERFMGLVGPTALHADFMNWGESLLNRDLPEMIAAAKRFGIETKLDANFNDASPGLIERLVLSRLDVLSLSIDGISPETYGRYRKGGDLSKVLANLEVLVQKRGELNSATPRIVWQFLVFKHNEHELPKVEAFAKERGVDQVSLVAPFLPNEPGYLWHWMSRDPGYQLYPLPESRPARAELERAASSAHARALPSHRAFRAGRFTPRDVLAPSGLLALLRQVDTPADLSRALKRLTAAWRRPSAAVPFRDPAERRLCKWPWAGMAVNPDGSASPCCSVEDQGDDFGSAFAWRWGRLWNGAKYRRARRHVARYAAGRASADPTSEHVCERCTAIGYANFRFPPGWEKTPNAQLAS